MKRHILYSLFAVLVATAFFCGCSDKDCIDGCSTDTLRSTVVDEINDNTRALKALFAASAAGEGVVSCVQTADNTYSVELESGNSITIRTQLSPIGGGQNKVYCPKVSIGKGGGEYYYELGSDEESKSQTFDKTPTSFYWTLDGERLSGTADDISEADGAVPVVGISSDDCWTVEYGDAEKRLTHVENGTPNSIFIGVDDSDGETVSFSLRGDMPTLTLKKVDAKEELISPTGTLRRVIDREHPAWIVHIDAWNYPDPQAIIDLIPQDVRPYVVFNIAFSSATDDNGGFIRPVDAYGTAKSWLSVCAENNVWAMVQPSSGGVSHWPDYDSYAEMEGSVFEELYQRYPNFLGFNYAEQGWGYGSDEAYLKRLRHFANLLRLSHDYGGYLTVSFFNPGYGAACNGVAMIKRSTEMADACLRYHENFIPCEKFTQKHSFHEMESTSLGVFLSGFADNYGIRFDGSGWYADRANGVMGWNGDTTFPPAVGAIPVIEHVLLTGETVIDGPELVRQECFKESSAVSTGDGYSKRQWTAYPQFENISTDIFRKIIDGTIHIMSRNEVAERTKLVVINDITPTGATKFDAGYSAPATLFKGLYLLDEDGTQDSNHYWFKKTGRYPTIPTVARLNDNMAQAFPYKVNASEFLSNSGWGDVATKQERLNNIFPSEYSGDDIFAGRQGNRWVVYNCYADTKTAVIPLRYNTCETLELSLGKYFAVVAVEQSDGIDFYITNYTADRKTVADKIKINGCTAKPSYTVNNRVSGNECDVTEEWNGVRLSLTVKHNGALDLHVSCSGTAKNRTVTNTTANVTQPAQPATYSGTLQYEAENFEYKNIDKIQSKAAETSGCLTGFVGLGYLEYGQKSNAAVRCHTTVNESGYYTLRIRYCSPTATVSTVDLYVNGSKVIAPKFVQTGCNTWHTVSATIALNKGRNTIELKANSPAAGALYLDYVALKRLCR